MKFAAFLYFFGVVIISGLVGCETSAPQEPVTMRPADPPEPTLPPNLPTASPKFQLERIIHLSGRKSLASVGDGWLPMVAITDERILLFGRTAPPTESGSAVMLRFDHNGHELGWEANLPLSDQQTIVALGLPTSAYVLTINRDAFASGHYLHTLDGQGNLLSSTNGNFAQGLAITPQGILTNTGRTVRSDPSGFAIEIDRLQGTELVPYQNIFLKLQAPFVWTGLAGNDRSIALAHVDELPSFPERTLALTIQDTDGNNQEVSLLNYRRTERETELGGFAVWPTAVLALGNRYAVHWSDYRDQETFRGNGEYLTMVSEDGRAGLSYKLENISDLERFEAGFVAATYNPSSQEVGLVLTDEVGTRLEALQVDARRSDMPPQVIISPDRALFVVLWATHVAPFTSEPVISLAMVRRK
ncbi:hypothetical protein HY628_01305 [Candidatus Uhrbacteria bacterium]|nr:hypothetical protein [Candidatus Uhrbacteria bacterium]